VTRFLFVVPPLVGHVTPLVGVARRLAELGHDVAWVGGAPHVARLDPTAVQLPCPVPPALARMTRPGTLRGFAALKFLWEDVLVPLTDATESAVDDAVSHWEPDLLVVDQQALAGALVGQRRGLHWVTSASTSAELSDPLAGMPKVAAWLSGLLDGLRARHGVTDQVDPRFSPHGVMVFSTEELAGAAAVPGGGAVRFVGPAAGARTDPPAFRWDAVPASGRPLVVVTMGTANAEPAAGFLAATTAALMEPPLADRVDAVVLDPSADAARQPRPGLLVVPSGPVPVLLRRAAVAVCHGGHNTVCEALSEGVPLVVAPIRDDQPIVAGQVVAAGAGIRLRFERATAAGVSAAVQALLDEPGPAAVAAAIRRSFADAGGAAAAARYLAEQADADRPRVAAGRSLVSGERGS
jgi:MGT family glycosyltransferase